MVVGIMCKMLKKKQEEQEGPLNPRNNKIINFISNVFPRNKIKKN